MLPKDIQKILGILTPDEKKWLKINVGIAVSVLVVMWILLPSITATTYIPNASHILPFLILDANNLSLSSLPSLLTTNYLHANTVHMTQNLVVFTIGYFAILGMYIARKYCQCPLPQKYLKYLPLAVFIIIPVLCSVAYCTGIDSSTVVGCSGINAALMGILIIQSLLYVANECSIILTEKKSGIKPSYLRCMVAALILFWVIVLCGSSFIGDCMLLIESGWASTGQKISSIVHITGWITGFIFALIWEIWLRSQIPPTTQTQRHS